MYFDLNDFKAINDTCGHSVGDEVLQVIAQRLRDNVPESDVVARIGGDEFLVLSFTNDTGTIEAMVDALDQQLRQPVVVEGGEVLHLTLAVGISYANTPWLQLTDLLRDSDRDMYRSKSAMRSSQDRVEAPKFVADIDRSAA